MKINYDKTSVYRIGSIQNTDAKFYSKNKVKWTNEPVNMLGYWIAYSERQMNELNYDPIMSKANSILSLWHHRGLSLFGKILVINSLVISLYNYVMYPSKEFPHSIVTETKKLFTQFIWSGKSPKIDWATLTAPKQQGGAGLVNIYKKFLAFKLSWVSKVLTNASIAN